MSATENRPQPQPYALAGGVSMRDLLASCAAAEAVSTPPRVPDPGTARTAGADRPQAA
ncbi:hypothetical protein M2164_003540 [Streptomyces sp. SAI-208]|uniref:hypothetical protein n=1 Tax=unclassified Streptomyces TaxID=2593676 RepID=UPI002473A724|nr:MULTISPECIES: hypothetical protein [unclassified Streptomyces]MDH6517085.1 hypothetical protein [Streptomyces sp. SAI-090]MDH6549300.1 hypothetical protein [Streptomyces sp. SAI-041]MDH6568365.1 hypothetical protein [Streptomyces sp. SAI-117]MDH6586686.1 hypothetical protein [Streptomyces sp. SAI-133]MDH6607905.1 hypothetical protein [Streptomyces sp. SAI-208]